MDNKPIYDENGNASHYDNKRVVNLLKYERIYGTLGVMVFCEITAEYYRDRIGNKQDQSLEIEITKAKWYERASKYFFERLGTCEEIIVDNSNKQELPKEISGGINFISNPKRN